MMQRTFVLACFLAIPLSLAAEQPSVQVEPPNLNGSRTVESQTGTAVVRDYLESWQAFRTAMEQNRADLLAPDFVGTALDKLSETIHEQAAVGIHTRYTDRAHHLQIVFYSPEGLSLQMTDDAEYDMEVVDHDKVLTTQHMHARYLVVLTPAEARWRVRIFQAQPAASPAD
ncbi:MAG TPA: hypothetical protein VFN62_10775 [Acidobacteriaceae bacterium]|nr:hypothetical protein [Acidobacteriaceae bacterium]